MVPYSPLLNGYTYTTRLIDFTISSKVRAGTNRQISSFKRNRVSVALKCGIKCSIPLLSSLFFLHGREYSGAADDDNFCILSDVACGPDNMFQL